MDQVRNIKNVLTEEDLPQFSVIAWTCGHHESTTRGRHTPNKEQCTPSPREREEDKYKRGGQTETDR